MFDILTLREIGLGLLTGWYVLISLQGLWFLRWILHAWEHPEQTEINRSPTSFVAPKYSFTALLPVRHEEAVIGDTIRAIMNIDYPENLKELLVLVRHDDTGTIEAAMTTLQEIDSPRARLVVVKDLPVNKPNQLNWGLASATSDVVVVFDAEDQPHKDIYHIANTVMVQQKADVVQSGVQLINFRSSWFSALNCLEYYFWFKSALHYFSRQGVVPLGGNTVFFKRTMLTRAGGWNEECLTEDGEIGIRLSLAGARIRVVYDEAHSTREETPADVASFIKQRTRWNQGFLQILAKGEWKKFPSIKKRALTAYVLILPIVLAFLLLSMPLFTALGLIFHLPMAIALLSFIPLSLLVLQMAISCVGMHRFARDYGLDYPWWFSIKIVLVFLPYLFLLAIGGVRALARFTAKNLAWEKTAHINAHREAVV